MTTGPHPAILPPLPADPSPRPNGASSFLARHAVTLTLAALAAIVPVAILVYVHQERLQTLEQAEVARVVREESLAGQLTAINVGMTKIATQVKAWREADDRLRQVQRQAMDRRVSGLEDHHRPPAAGGHRRH